MNPSHLLRARHGVAVLAAALVLGAWSASTLTGPAAGATGPLQPVIVTLKSQAGLGGISGTRQTRLREVVRRRRATADASYATLRTRLDAWQKAGEVSGVRRLWVFNGLAMSATPAVIDALRADPLVSVVRGDTRNPIVPAAVATTPNLARIGAPAVWDRGDTGQGVTVAILDSGVDMDQADVAAGWRGGANSWFDPFGQHPAAPMDRSGHGTQVMGVITGGGLSGTAIGVAPGARWIAARVFNDAGQSTLSTTHLALQWVLDPDGDPATADAPQVLNNSWTFASGGCNLEFAPDIQTLRAAGILPVFAAGNFSGLSASPANNPGAFAVGSTTATDTIAGDSSRGPSACGEASGIFPELTAPGTKITTTDLAGFYATVTGTSIAAPHVAGALALLLSARPDLAVTQQENLLEQTAADLGAAGPDNTFGYGRLDVAAAHAALPLTPPPPPALDTTGPLVTAVSATPSPVASGAVTLAATATDAAGVTARAEWFEGADPGAGNGAPMAASDGVFDGAAEIVRADVDAGALAPGSHTLSVRARDASGNWGAPVATTIVVDRAGPLVSSVSATPTPVATGNVVITARAADEATATVAAEWFEGADPGAGSGTPMSASDGAFGASSEDVRGVVASAGLAPGAHTLAVRARDALGNWGDPVATTIVVDRSGPAVSAAAVTPSPTAGAATATLSALAADAAGPSAPASPVTAAEWFDGADPGAGLGAPMAAADGAFGGSSEQVTAAIPAAGMAPGAHVLSLRARDAAGNWGPVATVTLTVSTANAIFADGFESGGLGAWSSASGSARLAVTSAARGAGAYGLQATVAGNTPSYVQDVSPANETSYLAAFAFKPNGTTTNGNPTDILTALTGGTSPAVAFSVQYRRATGPVRLQVRLSVARAGGTSTTGWYTIAEGWHAVAVSWSSARSASASLRLDGVVAETLSRLDTSARRIETARLGPSGGLAAGMAGTEYFDAFSSSR